MFKHFFRLARFCMVCMRYILFLSSLYVQTLFRFCVPGQCGLPSQYASLDSGVNMHLVEHMDGRVYDSSILNQVKLVSFEKLTSRRGGGGGEVYLKPCHS